jgi:hypothetical protein
MRFPRKANHEIGGKSSIISTDLFIQSLYRNPVEVRQVRTKHDLLTSNEKFDFSIRSEDIVPSLGDTTATN